MENKMQNLIIAGGFELLSGMIALTARVLMDVMNQSISNPSSSVLLEKIILLLAGLILFGSGYKKISEGLKTKQKS
jgi:hypothetical protein